MFYLAGIVLTFFLVVVLISKKGKTGADRILSIWLFIIGLHLLFVFLSFTDKILLYPFLLGLNLPLPLLHGPFLFLYTASITNNNRISKYKALHVLPFFLMIGLFLPFFLLPADQKIEVYKNEGQGYEIQMLILISAIMISGVVYVALSLWLLRKHKQMIQDQFSSSDKINLAWLRYLIYGIGVIWLFVLFGNDTMIFNTVVVFVFFLGYFGINQVGIFSQQFSLEKKVELTEQIHSKSPEFFEFAKADSDINHLTNDQTIKGKYLRSSLSETAAIEIHKRLTYTIDEEKHFTNPELTLAELAVTLDVHQNILSQVINSFEGKSFYDYINNKRIEEFKRIVALPENQKYTLLALAHDCGFNSKSSFNRNFKKATGSSPSDYLRQTHIELQF
jgi:AraC-like DNA-binding protein